MNEQQQLIYNLYESNIGIIVPMIKDALDKSVKEYPYLWIERAVSLAVKNNARSWRYVEAVLKRWKVDGFDGMVRKQYHGRNGYMNESRDTPEARRKYGEWEEK